MKKLNKLFAILVAMAMVLSLTAISAFAAEGDAYETPVNLARIKKTFVIPEGVKDPTITATFNFEGKEDLSSGLKEGETIPDTSATVTYTGTGETVTDSDGITSVKYVELPIPTYTHAGVYVYEVTETTTTNNLEENASVQQSGAPYTVRYYVTTESGTPQIKYVTVQKDDGKVETFIDKDGSETWTNGDDSDFAFKNVYTVTDGTEDIPTPEDPIDTSADALNVKKTVKAVENQTKPATSEAFPFTITITPAAGQEATTLKAYIVDAEGKLVEDDDRTTSFNITGAASQNFFLKDGETLAFPTAPTGTRYTVEETLNNAAKFNAYTPSYAVTSDGSAADTQKTGDASAGMSLKTAGEATAKTYLLGANKKDAVAYTNTFDNSINTPTGILISNLPYIALALVAIGGLVAYVVVRRRQSDEA